MPIRLRLKVVIEARNWELEFVTSKYQSNGIRKGNRRKYRRAFLPLADTFPQFGT
jgi:hypothetical protein